MYKLAVLISHPIQYFSPLYRRIAQEPDIDLMVYYCSSQGLNKYKDTGFGVEFKWDLDLLEGYNHKFLPNLWGTKRGRGRFSLINLTIIPELFHENYDILLVHGHYFITELISVFAARLFGISAFIRSDANIVERKVGARNLIRRPILSLYYRLFAACLAIGTRNKEYYQYHGVADKRIFLTPFSVDNAFFFEQTAKFHRKRAEVRKELGLPDQIPVVLFAGKFTRRKRAIDLLKAYHTLRDRHVLVELAIVGSGEEERLLRSYVSDHKLEGVHFYGFQNQTELPKFYAASDIFVLPSENEPWGLIINEVMCASLPVIVTEETGAVSDLVHNGQNGFVFQRGNVDELSNLLDILCQQPDTRLKMGQASFELISHWGYEEVIQGIHAALSTVEKN